MALEKTNRMTTISIIIITRNEADNIADCLTSVNWADEIVVVDASSTDNTVDICKQHGAQVSVTQEWPGFGPQKNRALALASKEWVLSIDADERVSNDLRDEITSIINAPNTADAYQLPRSSQFCHQFMRHSGWYPDYVTRLFKRNQANFSQDIVHEKVIHQGKAGQLSNPLIHYSYNNLEEVIGKLNQYSSAGAQKLKKQQKTCGLTSAILRGIWAFSRTYFLRLGFLDGRMGFVLAVYNAEVTYYKYLKLMLLNHTPAKDVD